MLIAAAISLILRSTTLTAAPRKSWGGGIIKDKRNRLVLSTTFTMAREQGNPNSGGNHRYNLVCSVEDSLRQLDTDRIDLMYVHAWDFTTTPEEVMRAFDDLVRAGKILYVAICNTPDWRISQM